tara:strand:- start:136 stop:513 length:378 start_codon:yes stop_codon:yes gene_type:complete
MNKWESWADNLRPGQLMGIIHYNSWAPAVFRTYKTYDGAGWGTGYGPVEGLQYFSLCDWRTHEEDDCEWANEKAQDILNDKMWTDFIKTNANKRVFPIKESWLSKQQLIIYNAYKKRFNYEYKNY